MANKQSKTPDVIIPLRLPPEMKKRIVKLATKTGLTEAAVARLALDQGFASVQKMFSAVGKAA